MRTNPGPASVSSWCLVNCVLINDTIRLRTCIGAVPPSDVLQNEKAYYSQYYVAALQTTTKKVSTGHNWPLIHSKKCHVAFWQQSPGSVKSRFNCILKFPLLLKYIFSTTVWVITFKIFYLFIYFWLILPFHFILATLGHKVRCKFYLNASFPLCVLSVKTHCG